MSGRKVDRWIDGLEPEEKRQAAEYMAVPHAMGEGEATDVLKKVATPPPCCILAKEVTF